MVVSWQESRVREEEDSWTEEFIRNVLKSLAQSHHGDFKSVEQNEYNVFQ